MNIEYQDFGVKLIPLAFLVSQDLRIEARPATFFPQIAPPFPSLLHMTLQPVKAITTPVSHRQHLTLCSPMPRSQRRDIRITRIHTVQSFSGHSKRLLGQMLQHPNRRRRPIFMNFPVFFTLHHFLSISAHLSNQTHSTKKLTSNLNSIAKHFILIKP